MPHLESDPELERLIAEEEEIERLVRQQMTQEPPRPRRGLAPDELHALADYLEDVRSLPRGPFRAKELVFELSDGRRVVAVWDHDEYVLRYLDPD